MTYIGLLNDQPVLKITATRQQFDSKLSTVQETIASYSAITFAKLGLHKTDDKGAQEGSGAAQDQDLQGRAVLPAEGPGHGLAQAEVAAGGVASACHPNEAWGCGRSRPGRTAGRRSRTPARTSAVIVGAVDELLQQRLVRRRAGRTKSCATPVDDQDDAADDAELAARARPRRSFDPPPRQLVVERHQAPGDRPGHPVADRLLVDAW